MTPTLTTGVHALQRTAEQFGDDRGILYYRSSDKTEFRGYAELDRRARAIAQALTSAGHRPGERAIIAISPGLEWAEAVYGILYAGLAFVPIPVSGFDTGAALAGRAAAIADASQASVVITDALLREKIGAEADTLVAPIVLLEDLLSTGDAGSWTPPDIDADSMAWLFFTSGSTGDPKGVIGTHRVLLATAEAAADRLDAGPDHVLVGWLPLHHAMGMIMQVIVPVTNGGSAVLTTTEQFQRRPLFWLQLMSRHRATISLAGNFAFALCVQFATDEQVAELDLSSLTSLVSGSEPVRPETVRAFVERFAPAGLAPDTIAPVFGMTEAMLISGKPLHTNYVITDVDALELGVGTLIPTRGEDTAQLVSCGRPAANTTVVVVDPDTLSPVSDGQVGEIWVSSEMVSPGYFRRPEATAETFGFRLPADDRAYIRTGDLGSVLDDELYITGRLKEVIILRGRNIYPQDIEAAARQVSASVGIGAAFEVEGHPAPVALVAEYNEDALSESGLSLAELSHLVSDTVAKKFSLPALAVAFIAEGSIPRTATGKVRRRPTHAQITDGSLAVAHATGFTTI